MSYSLDNKLVIGVTTRALFDLTVENKIFEEQGVEAYAAYQIEHEDEILKPGPGFTLIKALLKLNEISGMDNPVEVLLMSRNSPDISLRILKSIEHYHLKITRAFFSCGAPRAPYLTAFKTDLFLSACEKDVQAAIDAGIAAGIICGEGNCYENVVKEKDGIPIRIAFDADAVVFSDEAEQVYQKEGLEAFESSEREKADKPLHAGPFAKLLRTISELQKEFPPGEAPIRTALVTARSATAHERVIRTLRTWGVRIDEAFFLGGVSKKDVLAAFGAQIFFDDQQVHTKAAAEVVPSARVPIASKSSECRELVV